MTILTFPTEILPPSSFKLRPIANTQSGGKSPFDGTEQTLELPGSRWACDVTWDGLDQSEWRPLLAFLADLGGRSGRFTWAPPIDRLATATGGHVYGAGQTGKTLATQGWSGGTYAARKGDLVGWTDPTGRPALHVVTGDCPPSGGGVYLLLAPAIRRSPADGAAIIYASPVAVWMLEADDIPVSFSQGMFATVQATFVEAIF